MNKTKVHELMRLADLYATVSSEKVANREHLLAALEAALAEPEQEPVAWLYEDAGSQVLTFFRPRCEALPLYTRPATPLSDEQIGMLTAMPELEKHETPMLADFARAVERLHGIGVKK